MSVKNLDIWKEARTLSIDVHQMTLRDLPRFELYEEGSQIRRSVKSIRSNIAEGYGRRRHKAEYLRFFDFAFASCLESTDHLETLYETGSLTDERHFQDLWARLDKLARMLNRFTKSVEEQHNRFEATEPNIQHPISNIPPGS